MDSVIKSRLGYGCYALGGAYGKKLSRTEGVGLIKLGYELGIRFFDTADVYETEEILGKALASCRDQVAIATKVGVSRAGVGKLSREHLVSCCHASLRRRVLTMWTCTRSIMTMPQLPWLKWWKPRNACRSRERSAYGWVICPWTERWTISSRAIPEPSWQT